MTFVASSMPDRDWWSALFPDPEGLLRKVGVRPGMRVLDLCCGDGFFTASISKITDGQVYGYDIDPDLLVRARAETEARGCGALGWIEADALEVADRLEARVDYVLIANTLHGVTTPEVLLAQAARVLAPGGCIGVVNWRAFPREKTVVMDQPRGPATSLRMHPKALAVAFASAGLVVEPEIDVPPYHYGMRGRLQSEASRRR